jgi:hypothetical protein
VVGGQPVDWQYTFTVFDVPREQIQRGAAPAATPPLVYPFVVLASGRPRVDDSINS